MFRRILIANRGEIAVRIIRACREMGIQTVAVYSEEDKDSLHVGLADESCCIGGALLRESYLNEEAILQAAQQFHADAIHPGYGMLSENAEFARKCEDAGISWIGPSPDVMDLMSRKDTARSVAHKVRVPVTPGTAVLKDIRQAKRAAAKIGYPVMLKARSGGGGKGIRIVRNPEELPHAFQVGMEEAQASFGDGALFMEKYLENIKHIEVQILADAQGHCAILGERDCSLQRSNQKLIEESPAPVLDPKIRKKLYAAAAKIVKAIGYKTVGTIEFLVCEDRFYFCEMNTRLQVEHTVTEMVTGIDLVKWQIRTAAGVPLDFKGEVPRRGCAMECRINAENPETGFPSCGTVTLFHEPGGPGVRFDTMLYQGLTISPYYDSLLGKLVVSGENRQEVIRRMKSALAELVVQGVTTNAALHMEILEDPTFLGGSYHTDFYEKFMKAKKE